MRLVFDINTTTVQFRLTEDGVKVYKAYDPVRGARADREMTLIMKDFLAIFGPALSETTDYKRREATLFVRDEIGVIL
jgi:hypothetical protein